MAQPSQIDRPGPVPQADETWRSGVDDQHARPAQPNRPAPAQNPPSVAGDPRPTGPASGPPEDFGQQHPATTDLGRQGGWVASPEQQSNVAAALSQQGDQFAGHDGPTAGPGGPADPGIQSRQFARPPLEPPQMGQLNRPIDVSAKPSPAANQLPPTASPGHGGQQPPTAQNPTAGGPETQRPTLQPPVGQPPVGQSFTAPAGQPFTAHRGQPPAGSLFPPPPATPHHTSPPEAGAPPAPYPPQPAQPAQPFTRPPLEPPQMGQLNRPLPSTEAADSPSGLPARAGALPPPASWPPAQAPATPAIPGIAGPEDAPSGLPPRPQQQQQQPTWADPNAERERGQHNG
ncbi:hypothetical protein DMB66_35375 [Actinoplanes sp. ATCC 53533]|nr:hypothetical protein DMB66_35375 [Actinoplanes sp. ATCC 53533]